MKNYICPLVVLLLYCAIACKTTETREESLDGKRAEMEAILNKHLASAESTVSVNYEQFHGALSDDGVVERIDLEQYEDCIQRMVNHSNKRLLTLRESGCETLLKQSLALPIEEAFEFRKKNPETFQRCDSISNALISEFSKEVVQPFQKLLDMAYQAPTSPKKKQG